MERFVNSGGSSQVGMDMPFVRLRTTQGRRVMDRAIAMGVLSDKSPIVFFVTDQMGRWTFVSGAWHEMLGRSTEDAYASKWKHLIHPNDLDRVTERFCEGLVCKTSLQTEFRLQRQDGTYAWVCCRATPLTDEDSKFVGLTGTLIDKSLSHEALVALEFQASRQERIFDQVPHMIWSVQESGAMGKCNQTFRDYIGVNPDHCQDFDVVSLFSPEDADLAERLISLDSLESSTGEFQARVKRYDGAFRWHLVQYSPMESLPGKPARWLVTATDVHDYVEASQQLAERERFLSRVGQASLDCIYLYDMVEKRNVWSNKNVTDMLGYTAEDLAELGSELLSSTIHPEDWPRVLEAFDRLLHLEDGDVSSVEYRMKRKDGVYVWIESRDTVFERDEAGNVVVSLGVARNISEQKESELAHRKHINILENALEGIAIINGNGQMGFCNGALAKVLERHPLAIIGKALTDLICEHDHSLWKAAIEEAQFRGRAEVELRVVTPSNEKTYVHMLITGDRDENNEISSFYCFFRNIHQQKIYEGMIEEQVLALAETRVELEARQWELEEANRLLRKIADTDGLTGLMNHRRFQELLESTLQEAPNTAVLLVDVDHFKSYNDSFGHPAGDRLLKQLARLLERYVEQDDFVARYGGEEFVMVMPNSDPSSAHLRAEQLRLAVEKTTWECRPVTLSIGVAISTNEPDRAGLIQLADQALYAAKHGGRNRVILDAA